MNSEFKIELIHSKTEFESESEWIHFIKKCL